MFSGELVVAVIGAQRYRVCMPLCFEGKECQVIVKEGFDFDGASIPRALWSLVGSPFSGGVQRAACIHDALYSSQLLPRKEADKIFLEAMKCDGVPLMRRYAYYFAVRAFGDVAWMENSDEVDYYARFCTVIPTYF